MISKKPINFQSGKIEKVMDSGAFFAENNFSENQIKAACLFTGIGGFARALTTSNVEVRWVNEKDNFAVETFRHNFPDVKCIHRPVEEISVSKDKLEAVDILTAGFPCQPFSIAGLKQGLGDERGQLFTHIIRLIKEFGNAKPKILLLENVRNFKTHDNGKTFQIKKYVAI